MNLELEVDSKGRSEFQGTSRRDGVSTIKDRRRSREDPSLTGRNIGRHVEVGYCQGFYLCSLKMIFRNV